MVFIEIFKIQYVGGRGVSIRALPTGGGAKAFLLIEDILSLPLVEDILSLPLGEGGPLAVDEVCLCQSSPWGTHDGSGEVQTARGDFFFAFPCRRTP